MEVPQSLYSSIPRPSGPANKSRSGAAVARQSAEFEPSVWGDYFISHPSLPSPSLLQMSNASMKNRVEELIKEVKAMLLNGLNDQVQQMELIDALQRLGVDYHFDDEIEAVLFQINNDPTDYNDLYIVSMRFRLLRQHRFKVSAATFNKFKDDEGNFKDSICSNLKGLLALHDAAYLSVPGEYVLHEAIDFTRSHLMSMATHMEGPLARKIQYSLDTPLHRRMSRLAARQYISLYEECQEESQNAVILELAKLDFHLLQLLHREEITNISKWYKELGFSTKLSFARDRAVECYFWVLGVFFEPQHSSIRMIMTKVINMFSFIDDIYDCYGTTEELRVFTDVIQRWDVEAAYQLEDFLKLPFISIDKAIKELENDLANDGMPNYTHYLKEKIKEVSRNMIQENKWRDEGYVPLLKEQLRVTQITTFYAALACTSFLGMGKVVTKEAIEWVGSSPKMIDALTLIARLMDDVVQYENKKKMKEVACAVDCYMKEHKTLAQVAKAKLLEMVEDAWKVMNEEYLNLINIPKSLLIRVFNLARMMETIYRNGDHYEHSIALKDKITMLLDQPVTF